jgi:hypothetical protein
MIRRLRAGVVVLLAVAGFAAAAWAQTVPASFTGTASVKKGSTSASAPVRVTVTRYATDAERAAVMKAVKDGGTSALRQALAGLGDAGFIQLGEQRTALKFAAERPTAAGRLLTVVTAEPILFLGAGIPAAKPMSGFEVAIAMIELKEGGGLGDLSPAAKVKVDEGGALVIDDYGATVIWLRDVVPAK